MTASNLVIVALLQEVVCGLETGDFVAELDSDLGRVGRFLVGLSSWFEGFRDVWVWVGVRRAWNGECAGAT